MINRIIFSVFLAFSVQTFSQDKAEQAIQNLDQNFPQEKIYMLFDKENYAAGDNIWFKSFVFDGYAGSNISTTLFVELYDNNKKLISKKLIPLYESEGEGNFKLPDDLKENIYYIQAYTTWMTNFNEDFQYIKSFAVYNPNSPEKLVQNNSTNWTVSAYPESGTFVDGINTKIAVRLNSKGENPTSWTGFVTEKENPQNHITDFKSFDQNVGIFTITPQKGKKYQLTVTDNKGNKQITDLPVVAESGINLQVKSNQNNIEYSIKSSHINDSGYYKIIATIGNKLVYKARIKKSSNGENFSIPTNQLINGILQFTLFDENENVVAQRLCFVQPQKLDIQKPVLKNITLNSQSKSLNTFEIAQNPQYKNYTVAIYDHSKFNEKENLLSTLWLAGDFTDKIDSPAQYFSTNRNTDALDALLISEKWKRFNWSELISGKFPIIANKPEPYISYNVRMMNNGVAAKNATVSLMTNGDKSGSKLFSVTTDNNGDLSLKNMAFYEPQKIYYQFKGDNAEAVVIPKVNFIPLKKDLPVNNYSLVKRIPNEVLSSEASQAIENSRFQQKFNEKVTDIEEVKLKGKKENPTEKLNNELSSAMFQSPSETIFDFVNDKKLSNGSPDVLLWLEGRVAGLQIKRDGADVEAIIRNKKADIYLDETRTEVDFIRGLNISNIAMIKVVKDGFFGGFGNSNGSAILIYTKKGSTSDPDSPSTKGLKQFTLTGYDKQEDFKNINYNNDSVKNTINDSRTNLYWNPKIEQETDQPTKVKFYNNDTAKDYRVIIIGLDEDTRLPLFYDEKLP